MYLETSFLIFLIGFYLLAYLSTVSQEVAEQQLRYIMSSQSILYHCTGDSLFLY